MAAPAQVAANGGTLGLEPKFVDVDGIRTRYLEKGTGQPMVFAQGAGWSGYFNANLWDVNVVELGNDFRAIAPDKLGTGMTDNPKRPEDYSIEAQVKHFIGFLDALELRDIHLVGQSRGGYLAARAALERPELCPSLIILNTQTLAPDDGTFAERRARLTAQEPGEHDLARLLHTRLGRLSYSSDHITDEFLAADVYMEGLPKAQETKRAMEAGGLELFESSLAAQKEETLRWIEEGRLQTPTLLYWGRDDPQGIFSAGVALYEVFAKKNEKARMYVVNQAGHFVFREKASEFNQVARAWAKAW